MEPARQQQLREKRSAAVTSVIAAVFLTVLKAVVGVMTGSLGILAEAAHSTLDLGAALLTLFAVRVSDRPADEEHPYGHGKVENLSALAETALLLVTCVWIIGEAIRRLWHGGVEVDPSLWAFLTMGISVVVDVSRSRVLARTARKYRSQALEADALHFSTDVWSSAVVIGGLALVWIGQNFGGREILARADALAALGVAGIVIGVSLRLGRRAVDALLDTAPPGLREAIAAAVGGVEGVHRVVQTRVRGSGSQVFVDLAVAVPRHLSFEESHAVTDQVRETVRGLAPGADVVINALPIAEDEGVLERILAVAAAGHFAVHNVTTHATPEGIRIDLDLEVPPELSFERAHGRASALEDRLRTEIGRFLHPEANEVRGVADVNVHIEPRAEVLVAGVELTPAERAEYVRRIEGVLAGVPQAHRAYDVDVQRVAGGIYLAFHLQVASDLSVAAVHAVTEDVENRLRRDLPQLGRVVIHAEPFVVAEEE
jgi:cation diffusion facilitator family transporter